MYNNYYALEIMSISSYWASVWQNALGCFIASVPAILISWWIFKKTLTENASIKKGEEKKKDEDRLKYFKYLMNSSYQASKLMEDGIGKFVDDIRTNPHELPDLTYTPLNGLRRVSELQVMDEVLFAFTSKNSEGEQGVREFEQIINR